MNFFHRLRRKNTHESCASPRFQADIKAHFELKKSDYSDIVSDQVVADLDYEECIEMINQPLTPIGKQFIYTKARCYNLPKYLYRLKKEDSKTGIRAKLNSYSAYNIVKLIYADLKPAPKWFKHIYLLPFVTLGSVALVSVTQYAIFLGMTSLVLSLFVYLWVKNKYDLILSEFGTLTSLANLYHAHFESPNAQFEKETQQIRGQLNRIYPFLKQFDGNTLEGGLLFALVETLKLIFLSEALVVLPTLRKIAHHRDRLVSMWETFGQFEYDMLFSKIVKQPNICTPHISKSAELSGQNLIHPLIENPIGNDFQISAKSMIISGSNMSGKTTFLRTVGVNVLLGRTLGFCFASRLTIPSGMQVESFIRTSDNVLNDESYFKAELNRARLLANKANSEGNYLFVIDELFKGTNTRERVACAYAYLHYIQSKNQMVIAATHDHQLCELLKDTYDNYHFTEQITANDINFDYLLKPGIGNKGNAVRLLSLFDFPEEISKMAESFVQAANHESWKYQS